MSAPRYLLAACAFVFVFAAAFGAGPAFAEKRVALVIGNSAYRNAPLANPANDARLMADTLRAVGFTLIGGGALVDLSGDDFRKAVQEFGEKLQDGDVALFYYAGHGLQVHGRNYLVPIDANPTKEADVRLYLVDAEAVLEQMTYAGVGIIVLDACRSDPFGGRALALGRGRDRETLLRDWSAPNGGLAEMGAPPHTLIAFATQPGQSALDGADRNSPFTKTLAETISRKPGLGLFDTFNEVQAQVFRATHQRQKPFLATDTLPTFYFVSATQTENGGAGAPRDGDRAVELAFWESARNSDSIAAIQAYLDRYPDGAFAALAKLRLQELRKPAAQAQAGPQPQPKELQLAALPAAKAATDPHELVRSLQLELKRVGCFHGAVNGELDDATRSAAQRFTRLSSIKLPDDLTPEAIGAVRAVDKRVCPVVCPEGERSNGERCVEIERPHRAEHHRVPVPARRVASPNAAPPGSAPPPRQNAGKPAVCAQPVAATSMVCQ